MSVRVLVVEDDSVAAAAHGEYVGRVPGFEVAGIAATVREAVHLLGAEAEAGRTVDLLLLDLHLPDGHGLALLQRLRAAGHWADVIAVTSARDREVVARAVSLGVVLYLIKPFTFAGFRDKLEQYAAYRAGLGGAAEEVAQDEVDSLLGTLRRPGAVSLPKGMTSASLSQVTDAVRGAASPRTATEVAVEVGVSRVTARRYLEHLAEAGTVRRAQRYGGSGRPEVTYAWSPA